MKVFLIIIMFLSLNTIHSQNHINEDVFVNLVTCKFNKEKKKYLKKCMYISNTNKLISNTTFQDKKIKFILIPEINYKKRTGNKRIDTSKFISYLNPKDMILEFAYVFQDDIFLGVIKQSSSEKNEYELKKRIEFNSIEDEKIFQNIINYNPDIIFKVVNVNHLFFVIKDSKLYTLTYDMKKNKSGHYEIKYFYFQKAQAYIEKNIQKHLFFIKYKKRKFIVSD